MVITKLLWRWVICNYFPANVGNITEIVYLCNEKFGTRGLCPEVFGFRGGTAANFMLPPLFLLQQSGFHTIDFD